MTRWRSDTPQVTSSPPRVRHARPTLLALWALLGPLGGAAAAQGVPGADPRYRTRPSDCRVDPPSGRPLAVRRTDGALRAHGYTAERVTTYTADARGLEGGELVVCSEYGRVEIVDSDDEQLRLQVRLEGFGEGAPHPAEAARRVIEETDVRVHVAAAGGRLLVRVWHATLGFTTPGGQPAALGVRLQVPARGAYRVTTDAYHGVVAVRRLVLAGGVLRGRVGDKFKGVSGYIGPTELDNVTLSGDVEIRNELGALGAPVLAKVRVASTARLTAFTGGDVTVAVQPHPDLGVRALAETNDGSAHVLVDGGTPSDSGAGAFRVRQQAESPGFADRPVRLEVRAASGRGRVTIASMPAAPLP
jgi:hypothetical protein